MTVTYQVGEGGHLDIDFWVRKTFLHYISTILDISFSCPTHLEPFLGNKYGNPPVQYPLLLKRMVGTSIASPTK